MPELPLETCPARAPVIRDATDDDALDVIEVIGAVFGEYPHCILDVDGEMPELRRPASYHREHGGGFFVAERDGRIVGCAGWVSDVRDGRTSVELKKLYVHRRERKSGLGGMFVDHVEAAARAVGAEVVDLWSDTRFVTAHAFYARRSYVRGPETRELHDKSDTVELYFAKRLETGGAR